MDSLVLELQKEALDSSSSIADLLRKALVASTKLGLDEFTDWINKELKGYTLESDVPEYRMVSGQVVGYNPFHGWQPVLIPDLSMAELLSRRSIDQSVAEIESVLKKSGEKSQLTMPLSKKLELQLLKGIGENIPLTFHPISSEVYGVVEAVRNIILEWALKLEKDGILGENMSFSTKEREAVLTTTYHIKNFFSHISNSQIQQDTINSSQYFSKNDFDKSELKAILDSIRESVTSLQLTTDQIKELEADIQTVKFP